MPSGMNNLIVTEMESERRETKERKYAKSIIIIMEVSALTF